MKMISLAALLISAAATSGAWSQSLPKAPICDLSNFDSVIPAEQQRLLRECEATLRRRMTDGTLCDSMPPELQDICAKLQKEGNRLIQPKPRDPFGEAIMAALSVMVADLHCPNFEADYGRLSMMMRGFGITFDDLNPQGPRGRVATAKREEVMDLLKNSKDSFCDLLWRSFGDSGDVYPKILQRR